MGNADILGFIDHDKVEGALLGLGDRSSEVGEHRRISTFVHSGFT
jgi:hypothetical protein